MSDSDLTQPSGFVIWTENGIEPLEYHSLDGLEVAGCGTEERNTMTNRTTADKIYTEAEQYELITDCLKVISPYAVVLTTDEIIDCLSTLVDIVEDIHDNVEQDTPAPGVEDKTPSAQRETKPWTVVAPQGPYYLWNDNTAHFADYGPTPVTDGDTHAQSDSENPFDR